MTYTVATIYIDTIYSWLIYIRMTYTVATSGEQPKLTPMLSMPVKARST
jgi:hypothetical protein